MDTKIGFENASMNVNIRQIGVIPELEIQNEEFTPCIWKVIRNCQFSWTHPFVIQWHLKCWITDLNGQISGPFGIVDESCETPERFEVKLGGSVRALKLEGGPACAVYSETFCWVVHRYPDRCDLPVRLMPD